MTYLSLCFLFILLTFVDQLYHWWTCINVYFTTKIIFQTEIASLHYTALHWTDRQTVINRYNHIYLPLSIDKPLKRRVKSTGMQSLNSFFSHILHRIMSNYWITHKVLLLAISGLNVHRLLYFDFSLWLIFSVRQHIAYICLARYMLLPVRLSVHHTGESTKTVEVMVMRFLPYGSPMTVVFAR